MSRHPVPRPRGAGAGDAGARIGEQMRELREARGMTLDRLAAATGFTKSYLSKIQNAKKLPPIATLSRIAQALGIGIGGFFDSGARRARETVSVVRRSERLPVVRGGTAFGYDYQGLAHRRTAKRMEPFIFTFPSRIDRHVFFEHEGEEFFYVLSGTVAFQVGDERWTLEEGDSVYFDARLPHRGWSLGRDAKALVVVDASAPRVPEAKRPPVAPKRRAARKPR